jgi:TPP-dependent pyruvate/acetoin dehydrogenase alpha subunit
VDIEAARKEDCIKNFEDKLIEDKIFQKQNVQRIEEKIHEEIENAINFARESPFPDDSELMEGLYA